MEENPIKEYLFRYIDENKQTIQKLLEQQKYSNVIQKILKNCYDKVISLGPKEEVLGTLATGLLHYLLTSALITSQRKVEYRGIELDVVIPDLKTLKDDPEKTLIILIPKSLDRNKIEKKLTDLVNIQPEKQNIWLVLAEKLTFENKTFVIAKENETFSNIIYEIGQFVNISGKNRFKILRI